MKKILALIVLILCAYAVKAQDKVVTIGGTSGVINVTGGPTSLAATGRKTAAYTYVFENDGIAPIYYSYSIRLQQKHALQNTATWTLTGALENVTASYKAISSGSWSGTTTDTVIVGGITSSPLSYKYYKFLVTPSDTVWVEHVLLNIAPSASVPLPQSR